MGTGSVFNFVATECRPDDDARFNKWYDEVHIPMLFKYSGMLGVTRYKLADDSSGQARYLAVYEFKDATSLAAFEKSPELAAARDEMAQSWQGKFTIKWRAPYTPLKTWKK